MAGPHPASATPAWFTPRRLLAIFCYTNLCVYLDRGLISSNGVNGSPRTEVNPLGTGIQGEFDLSNFEDGLLPAAFMVGLLVASVVFAEVCKRYNAFRLLGIGMGIWAVACLLCGLSPNYTWLMLSRMVVGVGEASFVAMAAPFIDDYAPAESKSKWFGTFYLCIPVGFACGYIVGGLVAPTLGWRTAFMLEAAAMVPFVVFALHAQPLSLHGSVEAKKAGPDDHAAAADGVAEVGGAVGAPRAGRPHAHASWAAYLRAFWADVAQIVTRPVWARICVGYTLYVAVIGAYAYWGPKAGFALFFNDPSKATEADLTFGGVTVLTGVAGSIVGGVIQDRLGNSMRTACLICAGSSLSGLLVVLPAFLFSHSFFSFMAVFAVGQLLIFMLQAPVVAVQMWCVPQSLRALGVSLMTSSIHLLGDVPSPPLLGLLQTRLSEGLPPDQAAQKWRTSMALISSLLAVSSLWFLWAAAAAGGPGADFRALQAVDGDSAVTGDTAPLLGPEDVRSGDDDDDGDVDEKAGEDGRV